MYIAQQTYFCLNANCQYPKLDRCVSLAQLRLGRNRLAHTHPSWVLYSTTGWGWNCHTGKLG